MIKGEISEDLRTYEIQHPLRLAKTASQDFGYEHQLQELVSENGDLF